MGGGIEWGYRPDLTFKAEGLVLLFNSHSDLSGLDHSDPGDNLDLEKGLVLQLGANWRPGAEPSAVLRHQLPMTVGPMAGAGSMPGPASALAAR